MSVIVYVVACTRYRDNRLDADAWEHHRALRTLTQQLWKPGNPTFAGEMPSVRYLPYLLGWAVICRVVSLDPYTALSAAATINTTLLLLGIWLLLKAFDEQASAVAVLTVMLCLSGTAPQYANFYALADLPWQQVNPSAFSFALALLG